MIWAGNVVGSCLFEISNMNEYMLQSKFTKTTSYMINPKFNENFKQTLASLNRYVCNEIESADVKINRVLSQEAKCIDRILCNWRRKSSCVA